MAVHRQTMPLPDVCMWQAVGMSQYIPQLSILLAMDWLIGALCLCPLKIHLR